METITLWRVKWVGSPDPGGRWQTGPAPVGAAVETAVFVIAGGSLDSIPSDL